RTLADMRAAREGLGAILDETGLHLRVCERWGLSPADVEATQEQQATVAYTRYVLDVGMSGDLLDLQVALIPCTLGYAEIGRRLAPEGVAALPTGHPYRDWIAEHAGEPFQQAARAAGDRLEDLGRRLACEARIPDLGRSFRTAPPPAADGCQPRTD